MTKSELLGRLRTRVGATDKGETSDERLMEFVDIALSILGDELSFRNVETDLAFALVADQKRYALPNDVLVVQWVEWSAKRLEPVSLTTFDRDFDDWRARESGSPRQFAIRGRFMYLDPPAGSTAVAEDGALTMGYVGAPTTMGAQGPAGLSDSDQWLLCYVAALEFCRANPSEMNMARLPEYKETIYGPDGMGGMMAAAKGRWVGEGAATAKHHVPRLLPFTGRTGGAR
jgi:hypothetical protein